MTQLEDKYVETIQTLKYYTEKNVDGDLHPTNKIFENIKLILSETLDLIRNHQHVQAEEIDITKHGIHGEVSLKKTIAAEKQTPDQLPDIDNSATEVSE